MLRLSGMLCGPIAKVNEEQQVVEGPFGEASFAERERDFNHHRRE